MGCNLDVFKNPSLIPTGLIYSRSIFVFSIICLFSNDLIDSVFQCQSSITLCTFLNSFQTHLTLDKSCRVPFVFVFLLDLLNDNDFTFSLQTSFIPLYACSDIYHMGQKCWFSSIKIQNQQMSILWRDTNKSQSSCKPCAKTYG